MKTNAENKPNVLFILDDQHRFDYLGCMGADFVRTPNLDRLAERGMLFTRCSSNSPLCVPARISLATGMQPARLGLVDNSHVLSPDLPTLYQRFRDGGYRVHCVGKLDLNKPDHYNGRYGDRPQAYRWGFTHPEECEGKSHAGSSPTPIGPYTHYLEERGLLTAFYQDYRDRGKKKGFANWYRDSALPTEAFEDCYIGRRAAEWIDAVPDDFPWFSFVSFVGPHSPFDPPTEYADRYRHAEMPAAAIASDARPEWVRRRFETADPESIAGARRQYCAAIETIDDQIGDILAALERRGMMDNTYILFSSDHGEMLGDHGAFGKTMAYEASVHVPLIVAGPGIAGGRVSDALIELIDLNATAGELAGLAPAAPMDSLSFARLVRGERDSHRNEAISTGKFYRSIRNERYKLIDNVGDMKELFDLANDPYELHNIAATEPELVQQLSARLEERFAAAQSPL
jgi:choline-sulfatase